MIIVGAKGFAKEILQIISVELGLADEEIVFFDNVNKDIPKMLFNRFQNLTSEKEVHSFLNGTSDKRFVLGLGDPKYREFLFKKFVALGAEPYTVISKNAEIGSFDVCLGKGVSVMSGTIITNDIRIGDGVLINLNCTIGHDTVIGDFVEISPDVNVSGCCTLGKRAMIGTSAVLTPNVTIGENAVIGAGAVVLNDVADFGVAVGAPARVIKYNK